MRVDGPRVTEPTHGGLTSLILQMNAKSFPDLAEHFVNGEPIVPAAAFIDMVRIIVIDLGASSVTVHTPLGASNWCEDPLGY